MTTIAAHSILQTAVVVGSRAEGVARVADLFAAVPTEREFGIEDAKQHGTVFAFGNNTFFELLDPLDENHTRRRFLNRNGPGLYMLSCALENAAWEPVSAALQAAGVRAVIEGPYGRNHLYRWHLHPKDAGGLLVLTSIMKDRLDNSDWAGPHFGADAPCNSRFVDEIRGVIARSAAPQDESGPLAAIGFKMTRLGRGAQGWKGPTGNVLELWPSDAWSGAPVAERRDYAIVIKPRDRNALLRRLSRLDFTFEEASAVGRLISTPDPVLGVRFAIDN